MSISSFEEATKMTELDKAVATLRWLLKDLCLAYTATQLSMWTITKPAKI